MKRTNYLTWKECFTEMAVLISQRSKDPNTQVGAVIVDTDNVIVSIGYNGFPRGCSDDKFPWDKGDGMNNKKLYVCHAEMNAIINTNKDLNNCKIYTTLFPCNECAKVIIQKKIRKIYYLDRKDNLSTKASKKMLKSAGVKYKKIFRKKCT